MLAAASDAIIIGFNVRPEGKATVVADKEGVEIRYYSVIYQAIEEIEAALKGMLKPEFEEVSLGQAEIREIFRSSKIGNIAGCMVTSGVIRRNAKARLIRDGAVVAENLDLSSLRREKDDVSEVREGFECGLTLRGFNDIKLGDVVESLRDEGDPEGLIRVADLRLGHEAWYRRPLGPGPHPSAAPPVGYRTATPACSMKQQETTYEHAHGCARSPTGSR